MGLFDAIAGNVLLNYKVNTDQAKAAIRELSGEQKKAAKEHAEALDAQGKTAESMAAKYAKGAAIIGASYLVIKSGIEAHAKESRLAAGSIGVDLDRLGVAAGGLKTRWELMTIAQAGSQGAWKLTTGSIASVIEGMRALEKKGFDAVEVQNALTESLKKGKLEGLDKFGLSIKSTGSAAGDLQSLMRQLSQATKDVGGDFNKAGDAAVRASVKFTNARNTAMSALGGGVDWALGGVETAGRSAGMLFNDTRNTLGEGDALSIRRAQRNIEVADRLARDIARRDETRSNVSDLAEAGSMFKRWSDLADKAKAAKKSSGGRGGGDSVRGGFYTDLLGRGRSALAGAAAAINQDAAGRAVDASNMTEAERTAAAFEQSKVLNADLQRSTAWAAAQSAEGEERSFLSSMFGPVDEFDSYRDAFVGLGSTVTDVAGQMFKVWSDGGELTMKSMKKIFAAEIAARSQALWASGFAHVLTGAATAILSPGQGGMMMATGAAEIAGAATLGLVARSLGGGSASTGTGAGPSSARNYSASSGHVMAGGNGNQIVVMGDGWADDSVRHRASNFRAIQSRASGYRAAEGIRHG